MTDGELAEFICGIYDNDENFGKSINGITIEYYDEYKIAEWLKRTNKEADNENRAI